MVIKLRFLRDKAGDSSEEGSGEEVELKVHPAEGLEIFKFQVSVCGGGVPACAIERKGRNLISGDSSAPVPRGFGQRSGMHLQLESPHR